MYRILSDIDENSSEYASKGTCILYSHTGKIILKSVCSTQNNKHVYMIIQIPMAFCLKIQKANLILICEHIIFQVVKVIFNNNEQSWRHRINLISKYATHLFSSKQYGTLIATGIQAKKQDRKPKNKSTHLLSPDL